jgi:hypothetical protein
VNVGAELSLVQPDARAPLDASAHLSFSRQGFACTPYTDLSPIEGERSALFIGSGADACMP